MSTHHLPVNHKREGEKEIRASPSTITEYFKEEKKEKISGKKIFYVVPRWQNKVSKKIFFQEIGCSSKGDNFPHKLAVKIQNAKSFRREIVFRIMVPISKWRRRLEICRVRPNRGKCLFKCRDITQDFPLKTWWKVHFFSAGKSWRYRGF